MVCPRCAELVLEYHNILRVYLDLLEFRKAVDRRGRAFELLQARIAEIGNAAFGTWIYTESSKSVHDGEPNSQFATTRGIGKAARLLAGRNTGILGSQMSPRTVVDKPNRRSYTAFILFLLSHALWAQSPPSIVGTWRVVAFETHNADGTVIREFGDKPLGYFIYDATGHLAIQVMENPAKNDPKAFAYFGTYTVDAAKGIVIHQVEGAATCAGSTLDPIFEFDPSGSMLKNFGGGMFVTAHGMCADKDGNIWIVAQAIHDGKGSQVFKLSQDGKAGRTGSLLLK
jgi:hypothetical protein